MGYNLYEFDEKGLDSDCPKCGKRGNGVAYHLSCPSRGSEHLHYECSRCGYSWTGNTLDWGTKEAR